MSEESQARADDRAIKGERLDTQVRLYQQIRWDAETAKITRLKSLRLARDAENQSATLPLSRIAKGEAMMDKDQIKEVIGGIKETVGNADGDRKTEADRMAEKAAGKVRNVAGGTKDTVRESIKR